MPVYFVQAEHLRLIKIGFAEDLDQRLSCLRSQSPDALRLVGTFPLPEGQEHLAKLLERELHERFAEHREHGEWFRPHSLLLDFIAQVAEPPADARPSEAQLAAAQERLTRLFPQKRQ